MQLVPKETTEGAYGSSDQTADLTEEKGPRADAAGTMGAAIPADVMDLPLHGSELPRHFGLVDGAKPLRGAKGKGAGLAFGGHFASQKALGPAPFESLLERDLQTLVTADYRIVEYGVQCLQLTYWAPNEQGQILKRTYIPDIVARDRSGQVIIMDAKADFIASRSNWRRLEPYIRAAFERDHGARFSVLTEHTIRAQPRLSNCQVMLSHRRQHDGGTAEQGVRAVIENVVGEVFLGQVLSAAQSRGLSEQEAFGGAMRLALAGVIELDMTIPLSAATRVKLSLS